MTIIELQKKLFVCARSLPLDEQVPYAFEKRVMSRIMGQAVTDLWSFWGRLLWRAAAPCIAVMLAMSIWAVLDMDLGGSAESLSADLEATVLAPVAQLQDSW